MGRFLLWALPLRDPRQPHVGNTRCVCAMQRHEAEPEQGGQEAEVGLGLTEG
jgi:hypothetical protein